ncbi:tyrosine recombinase XerC [Neobacillus notoginsengisoli]|uniref:Tyrosine recombinase XerC n=2 Tax=Neobacillus notoginsengisoli TaxID=1578198 RepID=A0A417YQ94_9BACI|nr:tyrosine recombinase XerC [Neobacillus notoginsengisoli]
MGNVNVCLKLFVEYLQIEKNSSQYTIDHYEYAIVEFFEMLAEQGIVNVEEVQYHDARLYLTRLFELKQARKTISRKISSLRSFYKFMLRENLIKENPFSLVVLPKSEKRLPNFFYEDELEVLFQSCKTDTPLGERNLAILELLYATGIRVSECSTIAVKDLDFFLSTVLVKGKGGKERYVPFGTKAAEALKLYVDNGRKRLLEGKPNQDALFLNSRGGALTARGIRLILDKMIEQSSLTAKIHPHKLRHTFATHLLNNGADLRTVQELLGHAFLSSTQIYTHVTNEKLKKTYMAHHPRA